MQTVSAGLGRQLCSLPTRHIQVNFSAYTDPPPPVLIHVKHGRYLLFTQSNPGRACAVT